MDLSLSNPVVITILLASAAGILLFTYWLIGDLKKKKKKARLLEVVPGDAEAPGVVEDKIACLVVDVVTRSYQVEYIPLSDMDACKLGNEEGIGRQWNYNGVDVYYLFRDKDAAIHPITPPETLDNPPSELYKVQHQDNSEIFFDVTAAEGVIAKYGWFFAVAVVAAFVIIATTQKG